MQGQKSRKRNIDGLFYVLHSIIYGEKEIYRGSKTNVTPAGIGLYKSNTGGKNLIMESTSLTLMEWLEGTTLDVVDQLEIQQVILCSVIARGSVLEKELRGIVLGVSLAIDFNIKKMEIVVNSQQAIWLINGKSKHPQQLRNLVRQTSNRLAKLETWKAHHTFREANQAANQLANRDSPAGYMFLFSFGTRVSRY